MFGQQSKTYMKMKLIFLIIGHLNLLFLQIYFYFYLLPEAVQKKQFIRKQKPTVAAAAAENCK